MAINLGLILKIIPMLEPINATPQKYIQNIWAGIHEGI